MILNSLHDLHKDLSQDEEAHFFSSDPAFEWRKIEWIILISNEGKFIDLVSCEIESEGKNEKFKKFLVPRSIERTGGSVPNRPWFLSDRFAFLFNIKIGSHEYKRENFLNQIKILKNVNCKEINPVFEFIHCQEELNKLELKLDEIINYRLEKLKEKKEDSKKKLKEEIYKKESFVFAIDYLFNLLTNQKGILEYWKQNRINYAGDIRGFRNLKDNDDFSICSVSNELILKNQTPFTHEYIRNLGSTKLIYPASSSYNIHKITEKLDKSSWKQQIDNFCPISQEASEKVIDALSFIAGFDNEQRISFGSSNYLFWTTKKQKEENLISSLIYELGTQEYKYLNIFPTSFSEIKKLFLNHRQIFNESKFYLLRLDAKNDGRYSITSWQETALEDIQKNIQNYHEQIKLWDYAEEKFGEIKIMPVKAYIAALKPSAEFAQTSNDDKEANKLATELTECILFGRRFPDKVLYLALKRLKTESKAKEGDFKDLQNRRIKLIQVYLLRYYEQMNQIQTVSPKEQIEESLAYKFGRWFYWIDQIQKAAHNSENQQIQTGVKEKYYAIASTSPFLVFNDLEHKVHAVWLKKLKRNNPKLAAWFEKNLVSACKGIIESPDFQARSGYNNLINQACFSLGFYHDQKDRQNTTEEPKKGENE